jgi:hypothetical protein
MAAAVTTAWDPETMADFIGETPPRPILTNGAGAEAMGAGIDATIAGGRSSGIGGSGAKRKLFTPDEVARWTSRKVGGLEEDGRVMSDLFDEGSDGE